MRCRNMLVKILYLLTVIQISFGDDYVLNNKTFPDDFMFGVATASYQIEGAWNEDGKTPNIWDTFTHNHPELIQDHSTGDVACDSYHKYEVDIELLKQLGVKQYRFSISWPRILPTGFTDEINEIGIFYYKNLIRLLKANNIIPLITLFHWDLPQSIQDRGGFLNSEVANWFADFARVCFRNFGDDVKYWLTFNEPTSFCVNGYGLGVRAPGIYSPAQGDYLCGHNLIKAHAAAWHVYDNEFRKTQQGVVTMAHAIQWAGPYTDSEEDKEASEQRMQFTLGWWANPIYYGDYPEDMKIRIANRSRLEGFKQSRLPEFDELEKKFVAGTSDYFAFNTYISYWVQAMSEPEISLPPSLDNDAGVKVLSYSISPPFSDGSWGMTPMLKWMQSHYGNPPIIITENGLGNAGGLEDDDRLDRVQSYLSRIRDAMDDGVNVFGYTLWSLMDNFEWLKGYTVKYGIHEVDFESANRTRTPRKSAKWYTEVIRTKCLVDKCE